VRYLRRGAYRELHEVMIMNTMCLGGSEMSVREVEQLFFNQMKLVSKRSSARRY
jgi:hypothetical protein